jgi:O-antigen/teichoic acid export membrane protein
MTESRFSRDVLTLVTGTSVSLIITTLASPIITRLYGPAAFGLVALFTSITGILGVIVCLRYELAIVLPKSDEEAANIFGLCMLLVVVVSAITIPLLMILEQPLVQFLKAPQLGQFFWLIPPTLLISGTFLALNYWNTRTKQFKRLSVARISSSFSTTGTQLGAGFLGFTSGGVLIYANVFGQLVSTSVLGLQIMRDHLSFFRQTISWKGMADTLRNYSNFPKYDVWSALINQISWQVPVLLLSSFFSTTIVGYYSLGMMMVTLPMSLIGGSIAQVFFQRAAIAQHEGSLSHIFEDAYSFLIKISLFPLLLLTFIGQDLFILIFGPSWGVAGFYIQILSVWAVFFFVSSPISAILSIAGKQKTGLVLSTINLITRFVSISLGGILGNATLSIVFFSLSGVVMYGSTGLLFMKFAGVPVRKTLTIIGRNFVIFLPAGAIMVLVKILNVTGVVEVFIATLLFVLYWVYLAKTDAKIREILVQHRILQK